MDVTKEHRVMSGLHFTYIEGADTQFVFFKDRDGDEQVRIVLADGRAYTRLTLGEFCELLYAIRKEIAGRHWGNETTDTQLNTYITAAELAVSV